MRDLVKASGGSGSRYESVSRLVSSLAYNEAMDLAAEALGCGCIDKIEDARDALIRVMEEAGRTPQLVR
jgi:hypothetical protein